MQRKVKIILTVVALIIVVGGVAAWRTRQSRQAEVLRTVPVARGSVVQDVTFTARLKAQTESQLAFESAGVVREVLVATGESVAAGQILARLDTDILSLEHAQAAAQRLSAQAETLTAENSASTALANTKAENARTLEQQRQKVRDAQVELKQAQDVWQQSVREDGDEAATTRAKYSSVLTAATVYHTAQATLKTLTKTAQKTNDAAAAALKLATEQHAATVQASGTAAGLSALQAAERVAGARLAHAVLYAPFAGVVTEVAVSRSEYVAPGTGAVTLATVTELEVTADVTETDAAKIMPGQGATITFDALRDAAPWEGSVVSVAPAAQLIEGVPTYEVRLALHGDTTQLKPGLTADVSIHANRRDNALVVPRRAVVTRDGVSYVRVREESGTITDAPVDVGLTGSDGLVEIVSGVTEGRSVVISASDE